MKKTFNFGKVHYNGDGKLSKVSVDVRLEEKGGEETFTVDRKTGEKTFTGKTTPKYFEFAASGSVGDFIGGQCLDEISKYIADRTFSEIYDLWLNYHLNGLNAGTPEQEKAASDYRNTNPCADYSEICEYLKSSELYEVSFTGKSIGRMYDNEPYKYGNAWIIKEIPEGDLKRIRDLF